MTKVNKVRCFETSFEKEGKVVYSWCLRTLENIEKEIQKLQVGFKYPNPKLQKK